jgi:hypothetical protein
MCPQRPLIGVAVAAALGALSGTSQAALTAFNSAASFAAATFGPATDTFTLLPLDIVPSPSTRTAGPYSYVASAPGGLFGVGTAANPALSTNLTGATLTLSSFGANVGAIGGSFFGSDITGAFVGGQNLTLMAADSFGATLTQTITGASASSFLGFASTGTLVSLTIAIANNSAFASVDNLVLAQAIPEPETYAMLLAGLAAVGAVARRRRSS